MQQPPPLPPQLRVQGPPPVDHRAIYYIFRERAWVVVLCLIIAGMATATLLRRSPNIYSTKTVLLVEAAQEKVVNIQRTQPEDIDSLEALKTVEQTLQNKVLMERVIDANNLLHDPRIAFDPTGKPLTREQLLTKISRMVEVKLRRGTRLVDITAEYTNPEVIALIANSLVSEFLRQDYEQNQAAVRSANEFLENQAQEIKTKLDAAEAALQTYKEQSQFISSTSAQNTTLQALDELSAKATEAKSRRIACEAAYKQVESLGSNVDALLLTPAAASSSEIQEIRLNITKAESDLADIKTRYLPGYPKYIEAENKLAEWQNTLKEAVLDLPKTALSALQSAQAVEKALNAALAEQQKAALEMNKKAIRYDVLMRDVESDRALYQTVLTQIKENTIIKDLKTSNIRVIERAEVPDKPIRPDKPKMVLTGVLCGLLSGIFLVFFLNSIDQSLKTVNQAEEHLGLPVLCAIPKFGSSSLSAKTEAFRTLRASLSMLGRTEDRRVFLFTSSLPGEGKTFCSLNYAHSLAQQGLKTLIIDCDLRRPMIERLLRKKKERNPGLTDYLTGQKTLEQVIYPTETANLSYLPGGTDAPNPAELLANSGFDGLIQKALTEFDRVVVDSAPIHVVSDTLLILNSIQTVCLVVYANRTPKNSVLRTVHALQQAGAPLAGVALNLLPRSATGGGYYYQYSYHGKYGS